MSVAVVRHPRSAAERIRERIENFFSLTIPQIVEPLRNLRLVLAALAALVLTHAKSVAPRRRFLVTGAFAQHLAQLKDKKSCNRGQDDYVYESDIATHLTENTIT